MATPIRNSMTDNSVKDNTNDAINGTEVDANPNALADILDGTTDITLGSAAAIDYASLRLLDVDNATGAVQSNLIIEWDPADGNQMTDNSSGVGIDFKMPDASDNQTVYASLDVMCLDDAATSEDGEFSFRVIKNAADTEVLTVSGVAATFTTPLTVGVDGTGHDVKFYGDSAGAYLLYDESADTLDVRGATAAGAGTLKLTTGELTVEDGDILGRIDFQAPLESDGTDAVLVGASIWAEADDTFAADLNDTDLVFAVAESETAAERMRLAWDGTTTQLYFAQVCNIQSAGDITLTAVGDVNIPADIGLTFGDDGEKIEGDGTDLTIASSNLLTLTATGNTVVTNNAVVSGTLASGNLGVTGTITGSGVLSIDDATDSTSGISGSVHTDGGLGVAKNVYISEELHLLDSKAIKFGTGEDATISYDGTDLTIAPAAVGSGDLIVSGASNVGIGVTPATWHSSWSALQIGGNGVISSQTSAGAANQMDFALNANYDTDSSWEYISTDEAAKYSLYNGTHTWSVAASGTAGNDITFVTAATVIATARWGIGKDTTAPSATLEVQQGDNHTTGNALKVYRNLTSSSTDSSMVYFHQDHASDDQAVLEIKQDNPEHMLKGWNSYQDYTSYLNWGSETSFGNGTARIINGNTWGSCIYSVINNANGATVAAGFFSYWSHSNPALPPTIVLISSGGSETTEVTTGELTGSTGTDNRITFSAHTDGLYCENRTGLTIQVSLMFING